MKSLSKIPMLIILISLTQCQSSSHPSKWSDEKLNQWFEAGEYLNGLQILPDPSIDRRSFAKHYYEHKEMWDNAFSFLKNTDLANIALGRVELDGNLFAVVSEYFPKDREGALLEVHQKYIDVQYVVSGNEFIDLAPLEKMTVTTPYNSDNDAAFGSVADFSELKASPDRFFIFFPADAHRPGMKSDNDSVPVRKIVVKIPIE